MHIEGFSRGYLDRLIAENKQLQAENTKLQSRLDKLANFNPDWDQLKACQESLREHMQMLNKAKPVLDAARQTLRDNLHLTDGDDCTLYNLREAFRFEKWEEE